MTSQALRHTRNFRLNSKLLENSEIVPLHFSGGDYQAQSSLQSSELARSLGIRSIIQSYPFKNNIEAKLIKNINVHLPFPVHGLNN